MMNSRRPRKARGGGGEGEGGRVLVSAGDPGEGKKWWWWWKWRARDARCSVDVSVHIYSQRLAVNDVTCAPHCTQGGPNCSPHAHTAITMGAKILPGTSIIFLLVSTLVAYEATHAKTEDPAFDDFLTRAEQDYGINFNSLLDQIISSARKALILAKEDSLVLPDFTEDFYHRIWPFVVHGHLHCTKGSLRSLASVRRTGDAKLAYEQKKLLVITPLGLDELVVNYDYDASILHMGTNGNLTANVTSNSITLAVEITLSMGGCKLRMEEARITDFGAIKVNLTGLYPFDGLSSIIAEKAADSLHETIRQAAEKNLQKRLQKVIDKVPCHLPGNRVKG